MSRLLLTKKGRPVMAFLFLGIASVILGFALLSSGELSGHGRGNSDFEDLLMNGFPFLFVMAGFAGIAATFATSKAYISIYDDHIEGAAINRSGFALSNFHFTNEYTVKQNGNFIVIICGSENYRIKLAAADASEVCRCVTSHKVSSAPAQRVATTPGQNILVRCPACNAPLKIPAGKGAIRLTCPKCKNNFQTKS